MTMRNWMTLLAKIEQLKLRRKKSGFTLVEVLIAAGILVIVILGLMETYIYINIMSNTARDLTHALTQAQNKVEEIRNTTYSSIATNYASGGTPGNKFNITSPTGEGVVTIDSSNSDLLQIDVVICFSTKGGRIIGEDTNLNGVLNAGEDTNGNGKIDSPVHIITNIAKR